MSPRAAWRLETLGIEKVYDYVPGKADWFAAGLPREGTSGAVPRAQDAALRHAVTCQLTDRLGDAADRARAAGQDGCLVLTDGGVVLGRVREQAFSGDADTLVEAAMESGPTTVRPDEPLEGLVERLRARNVPSTIVTTSDGVFVGTLSLEDAERRLVDVVDRRTEEQPSCDCRG